MKTRLPVLLLAAAAASCGYKPVKEGHPAKQPAYAFPHSTHVDAGVACTACHDVAQAKTLDPAARHVKLPAAVTKQQPCADCHDKEPKPIPAARTREVRLTFSHEAHFAKAGLKPEKDCGRCHQKLTEPGDAAAPAPPMAACTGCHRHQKDFAEARCTPCHLDLKGYRPESAFRHEGNWLATHGALARPSAESCAQCHDQTYCAGCHSPATAAARLETIFPERVDRAFIHRGDYVSRHMVDAGANPASCRRCHGSAFCDACHTANGFTKTATGPLNRPQSHGADWVGSGTSPNRHAAAARRDITSCAGCHDQAGKGSTCTTCHAATGSASNPRNPHPKKFLDRYGREDIAKNGMCKACH